MNKPIFVTGVERSGSTIIAKIFELCGAHTGNISTMSENIGLKLLMNNFLVDSKSSNLYPDTKLQYIPPDFRDKVYDILEAEGYKDGSWMCKSSLMPQMWPTWFYAYPNARWVIVRRRTGDIIESCMKTGYMTMFKNPSNLKLIKAKTEAEGWLWWVHQYEKSFVEMIEAGVNCKIVWPERMVTGDYQQIYETLDWLGLEWNPKIVQIIDPMLNKSRRKLQWHEQPQTK
jgi:hypothetical protein